VATPELTRYDFASNRRAMPGVRLMDWARVLAFVTGSVDQELLARAEYLAAENRILKAQLKGRLKLSDAERATLAEIGHRLGRKALADVATVARPDTILAWYRNLVGSQIRWLKDASKPGPASDQARD
jgi:putative transposase